MSPPCQHGHATGCAPDNDMCPPCRDQHPTPPTYPGKSRRQALYADIRAGLATNDDRDLYREMCD